MYNFDNIAKKWSILIKEIECDKEFIEPLDLAKIILNWTMQLKTDSSDKGINYLFESYVSHYSKLPLTDYEYDTYWFDLNDLLEYDVIKPRPSSINGLFEIINLILTELLVFKTNIDCPHCDKEYRAYMDQESNLYLYCEQCNYYKGHTNDSLEGKMIIPASRSVVEANNLIPAIP